jgi:ribosomal protein S24E
MEIKQDTRNDLFKRQEIILLIEAEKNPGFEEMKKKIAEKFGKPEENIDVYNIVGSFGRNSFEVSAFVYDTKEDLDKMARLKMTKKQRDEAKKAEEEAKQAAREEAEKPSEEAEKESAGSEEKPAEETAEEVKEGEAPVEERPEQVPLESKEEPTGTNVEDRPEEEKKAAREETAREEEAKEA